MNNSEIKEWRMELRSNDVSMAEETVKAHKKKLEDEEMSLDEQHMAEENEEREESLAEREREVAETRDNLRRLEFKFKEKNAILDILLMVWSSMKTDNLTRKWDIKLMKLLGIDYKTWSWNFYQLDQQSQGDDFAGPVQSELELELLHDVRSSNRIEG